MVTIQAVAVSELGVRTSYTDVVLVLSEQDVGPLYVSGVDAASSVRVENAVSQRVGHVAVVINHVFYVDDLFVFLTDICSCS